MPRPSSFPAANQTFGGDLADHLRRYRAHGASYAAIARILHEEHRVTVTGETLRRWCADLGIVGTRP